MNQDEAQTKLTNRLLSALQQELARFERETGWTAEYTDLVVRGMIAPGAPRKQRVIGSQVMT
jgi:hypothetical protein